MVRGKSLVLFLLVGLTALCLAGCAGDEKFSKNPTDDAEQASGGEAENPFGPGTADGGIPIEGDEATAEEKQPAETAAKAAVVKPVEITKNGGSLGACVIGEPCERKISAKGGSGEYAWSIEGQLPEGLELVDTEIKKVKIQKTDGREIDKVGEFTFTLKVEDQADAERSAEREFTLTIKENIAMALYTMGRAANDSPVWTPVEENAQAVTVPPHGLLLVEVIGHAENYKWSIGGTEIVCNDQSCEGTKDGLTLYKDTNLAPPEPRPAHFAYMILKAEEDFIGQEAKNVVISVADAFGDAASKVISSITFQQDPCKIPIVVTGQSAATKARGETYSFTFTVSGGKPPYTWFNIERQWEDGSGTWDASGTQLTFAGTVPSDMAPGAKIKRTGIVNDRCPPPQEHPAEVSVTVNVECRFAEVNHVEFNAHYAGGNSDTDVCNETKVEFQLFTAEKMVGRTGNIAIDTNDNDIIDDLSPTYSIDLDNSYCLEDIIKFGWWIDGNACWEFPEVFVDKVLVVASKLHATWKGSIGEEDLGEPKTWYAGFNICNDTSDLWCDENPWPNYLDWET